MILYNKFKLALNDKKTWAIILSSDLHFGSLKSVSGVDIRADKKNQVVLITHYIMAQLKII